MRHLGADSPAQVLVVGDPSPGRDRLEPWLRSGGYECALTDDPAEAFARLRPPGPGLIVLDIEAGAAPEVWRRIDRLSSAPSVLTVARRGTTAAAARALARGAHAILIGPFGRDELLARVGEGLRQRRLGMAISRLIERYSASEPSRGRMLGRLTRATRLRDEETGGHVERSGVISARLAAESGWDLGRVERLRLAAPLHDLGKIAIPDAILLKPGTLTAQETFAMQAHTLLGAQMLAASDDPALRMAREIALCHHERWDGRGYPAGLAGDAIPEAARVVAIVDVFDALTHDRIYRPALPEADALSLMREGRGTHFDPRLLEIFLARITAIGPA